MPSRSARDRTIDKEKGDGYLASAADRAGGPGPGLREWREAQLGDAAGERGERDGAPAREGEGRFVGGGEATAFRFLPLCVCCDLLRGRRRPASPAVQDQEAFASVHVAWVVVVSGVRLGTALTWAVQRSSDGGDRRRGCQ